MPKVKADYKIEGAKLVVTVSADFNEDGEPVIENETRLNILEIPDEVMSAMVAKKAEAKA